LQLIMTFRTLLLLATALFASQVRAAAYDFSYVAQGDVEVRPVQVFDDGAKTYFQFIGSVVPVIVARSGTQEQLVEAHRAGQLLAVPALAGTFQIRYANLVSTVRYIGAPRAMKLPEPATSQPVATTFGADATPVVIPPSRHGPVQPVKGPSDLVDFHDRETLVSFARGTTTLTKDAARKILLGLMGSGTVERVVIVGRDDAAYVEGTARARGHSIRDRVIAAGVPGEKVVVKEMPARDGETQTVHSDMVVTWARVRTPAPRIESAASGLGERKTLPLVGQSQEVQRVPGPAFTMSPADKTLAGAVRRWTKELGYELVWDAAAEVDAAITGEASFEARNIKEALDILVRGLKEKGYEVEVTIYSNRVIRFAPPAVSSN